MTEIPDTPAVRAIRASGLPHEIVVAPRRATSAADAAELLGLQPGRLIKTIVVRVADGDYRFVLVPGPNRIAWPPLRSLLGTNRMSLPDADEARDVTGYERGTITPLGATTAWPVIADPSLATPERVGLGSGAHGVSIQLAGADLIAHLEARVAEVTEPA